MNSESHLRKKLLAVGMAVALTASACGGSTDEAADADSIDEVAEVDETEVDAGEAEQVDAGEDETTSEEETVEEEAQATDEGDVEDASDAEGEDDSVEGESAEGELIESDPGLIPAGYEEFCARANDVDVALTGVASPADGFEILGEVYVDLVELSPDPELAEDLALMAEVSSRFAEILSEPGVDLLNPSEESLAELEALSTPDAEGAASNVERTLTATCGTGFGEDIEEVLDETIALDGPGEFAGSMDFGTYDVYEIDVAEGTSVTVTMQDVGSGIDPVLEIFTPDGSLLVNDDFPGAEDVGLDTFDSRIVIDSAAGGVYMIESRSFGGSGDGDFLLTVEFG